MITTHRYLDRYPIASDSQLLILGTIHPHDTENFLIPFFYGNVNSLWNILSDAFPESLPRPIKLEGVLNFLNSRKIAISDTIRQCRRNNPTALDEDLVPEILNKDLVTHIRQSRIERVLCTSGFGRNNAFRLFYEELLGLKLSPEIRKARQVTLPRHTIGRPAQVSALYSPSGSSNVALSRMPIYLEQAAKYSGSHRPVYDFKVDYYRQQFTI